MKTKLFKLFVVASIITFTSCKKEEGIIIDYKYADQPKVLACEFTQAQLYNEAIHSFENDIRKKYDKKSESAARAYSPFLSEALNGRLKIEDVASEHSLAIAKALKKDASLWRIEGNNTTLNYSNPLVDCIANNIKDQGLKTTFNALLSTNSMRPNLILTPLRGYARQIKSDGSIAAFIAFEFYYSKLLNMEPSQLKKPEVVAKKPANKVDFNKVPKK